MPTMGWLSAMAARRAVEGGVAVGEDATVGGDQPVALAVGGRRHPHDGPVEGQRARRAVEGGVAVGEEPAAGRPEHVGLRRGQHRDQRAQDEHDRRDDGASETELPCPEPQHGVGSVRGRRDPDG